MAYNAFLRLADDGCGGLRIVKPTDQGNHDVGNHEDVSLEVLGAAVADGKVDQQKRDCERDPESQADASA